MLGFSSKTYSIAIVLVSLALCAPARAERLERVCRAFWLGIVGRPAVSDATFQAYLRGNLNLPQTLLGGAALVSAQMLRDGVSAVELFDSKLSLAQLADVRQAANRAHAAHAIPSRAFRWAFFSIQGRSIANPLLRAIFDGSRTVAITWVSEALVSLEPELPIPTPYLTDSLILARAIDTVRKDPKHAELVAKVSTAFEIIEAAMQEPDFKEAARVYRANMRGGKRPGPAETRAIRNALHRNVESVFERRKPTNLTAWELGLVVASSGG